MPQRTQRRQAMLWRRLVYGPGNRTWKKPGEHFRSYFASKFHCSFYSSSRFHNARSAFGQNTGRPVLVELLVQGTSEPTSFLIEHYSCNFFFLSKQIRALLTLKYFNTNIFVAKLAFLKHPCCAACIKLLDEKSFCFLTCFQAIKTVVYLRTYKVQLHFETKNIVC